MLYAKQLLAFFLCVVFYPGMSYASNFDLVPGMPYITFHMAYCKTWWKYRVRVPLCCIEVKSARKEQEVMPRAVAAAVAHRHDLHRGHKTSSVICMAW